MGLFDIFKKDNESDNSTTDNGILGPTFLDGLTEQISNPKKLKKFEWRRQLKTTSGQTKFKIKFYGQPHKNLKNLIVGTDDAPALVFALDSVSGQEILLFDGCKHGFNAIFCGDFTEEQIKNRPVSNIYKDSVGSDTFEVVVSTYYQINYDDKDEDFLENVDDDGLIEINDGSKIKFEDAKRNGFDVLQIFVTNNLGKTTEIVSEELA